MNTSCQRAAASGTNFRALVEECRYAIARQMLLIPDVVRAFATAADQVQELHAIVARASSVEPEPPPLKALPTAPQPAARVTADDPHGFVWKLEAWMTEQVAAWHRNSRRSGR